MCSECIEKLQETINEETLKPVPGRILIHFDDEPCGDVGVLLSKEEVETGFHDSLSVECWCHPFSIEPSDTRTAAEIWNDAGFQHEAVQ